MSDFTKKILQIKKLKQEVRDLAYKIVNEYKYTEDQLEEMDGAFHLWVQEGQHYEYYPSFSWQFPELAFVIDDCVGNYLTLCNTFEPLGVRFK